MSTSTKRQAATRTVGEQVDRETDEVMRGIAGEIRDESGAREEMPDYIGVGLGQVGGLMPHPSISKRLLGDETKAALLEQAAQFRDSLMALNPSTGRNLAMAFGENRVMVFPMGRVLQAVARAMLTQAYYSAGTARRAYEGYQALSATLERRRETNPDAVDGDVTLTEQSRAAEKVTRSLLDACTWMALAKVLVPFAMRETDGEPILARVRNPAKQDERTPTKRPVSDAVQRLAGLGGWTEAPSGETEASLRAEAVAQDALTEAEQAMAAAKQAEAMAKAQTDAAAARELRRQEAQERKAEREAAEAQARAARKAAAETAFAKAAEREAAMTAA